MASLGFQHSSAGLGAAPSVEQITQASQAYEYSAQLPLRNWLRTASVMLRQAENYLREGDDVSTYLLLYRHAHLVLANLTVHADRKDPALKSQLEQARRDVDRNLKTLDLLKPKINERHERYVQLVREKEDRQKLASPTQLLSRDLNPISHSSRRVVKQLHGHEHSELAVQLAHRERDKRATRRRTASGTGFDGVDISKQVQSIQALAEGHRARENIQGGTTQDSAVSYNYPSVRSHDLRQIQSPPTADGPRMPWIEPPRSVGLPPSRPPKVTQSDAATGPPKPDKVASSVEFQQTPNEPSYTFVSSASLENGSPLRTLYLPATLRTSFLRIADTNTRANLETCAFLAGTLMSNALFVSKLIVPAQTATSDTCEMTNESQLFDYVDAEENLMILGWIHTHPSQTCFMSSRDLHTHAGYQMMLAESIAIVCAPSKGDTAQGGDWGAYRLTDPPGKMTILNCTKPGVFHPHDVDNIYTDALRPGHVVVADGLKFDTIDLRHT